MRRDGTQNLAVKLPTSVIVPVAEVCGDGSSVSENVPDAPDAERDLHALFRKEYRANKTTGWAVIDIDHPVYVRYAGLDPVLAAMLFRELAPMVKDLGLDHLSQFEHHFQILLAIMQRKGLRLDVPYTERLKVDLLEEAEHYRKVAARYGGGWLLSFIFGNRRRHRRSMRRR